MVDILYGIGIGICLMGMYANVSYYLLMKKIRKYPDLAKRLDALDKETEAIQQEYLERI